jgi:hypothetical protein
MKRCSYCGAEYPDEAIECAIDKTPFGDVPSVASVPTSFKLPRFAIFSEYEIPVSLAIVSYLFFLPGGICLGFVASAFLVFILVGGFHVSGVIILSFLAGTAYGIFCLCLSRGLRRCSRGWRTCALVIIWWGFIAMAYSIFRYLQPQPTPRHDTPMVFWLEYGFGFIVQVWQYRVLTRPDIRDLFGV